MKIENVVRIFNNKLKKEIIFSKNDNMLINPKHYEEDNPHIENRFGYHWKELLVKYQNKEFIPGTQYVIV